MNTERHCEMCGATEGQPHHDRSLPRNMRRRIVMLVSVNTNRESSVRSWLCMPCFDRWKESQS